MKRDTTNIPGATMMGIGGVLLLGLCGGVLAIRAVRQRRARTGVARLARVWEQVGRIMNDPNRHLTLRSEVRRRLGWAAASGAASLAARQFAGRALAH